MSRPIIVTCAITGARGGKNDSPHLPLSPSEQIESAHEAFEAGAALLHLHARDDAGRPTFDPDRHALVMEGVRQHCPGMILEISTSGRGVAAADSAALAAMLSLQPDLAAIALGSVNFPADAYVNPPQAVEETCRIATDFGIRSTLEVFDLSMLYVARRLLGLGHLKDPLHFHIVLGSQAALPAHRQVLDFMVCEMQNAYAGCVWTASGLGAHQEAVMDWSLYLGGHIRTGLEDSLRIGRAALAPGNGALVQRAVAHCVNYGCHAASPQEARRLLGLETA